MCQKVWLEESKVGNDIIILKPQNKRKEIIVKMDTMLDEYRIGEIGIWSKSIVSKN